MLKLIIHNSWSLIHNSWPQFSIRNRRLIAVSLFLLFKAYLFLCVLTCMFSVCPALFIALWKMWFNPSEPSIVPRTAFCCPLFPFTETFVMWKNLESQFEKKKPTKCQHVKVLEPNLEHTLEIRTAASKPGPTCLMRGKKKQKQPSLMPEGPLLRGCSIVCLAA